MQVDYYDQRSNKYLNTLNTISSYADYDHCYDSNDDEEEDGLIHSIFRTLTSKVSKIPSLVSTMT